MICLIFFRLGFAACDLSFAEFVFSENSSRGREEEREDKGYGADRGNE